MQFGDLIHISVSQVMAEPRLAFVFPQQLL